MQKNSRLEEYKVLGYRMLLAYVFYFIARVLFYVYNADLIEITGFSEFMKLAYHGLAFDTSALLYINSLFILLSIFPLWVNTHSWYQKMLFYLYCVTNLIGYATNFVDFIYYKFIYTRTTTSVLGSVENESNLGSLLGAFFVSYWHVFLLFFLLASGWVFLYKRIRISPKKIHSKWRYFGSSVLAICLVIPLCIGGIRGDFRHSTRPINMVDANRHVKVPVHADIVLNTPFSIIRTIGKNDFKAVNFVTKEVIDQQLQPIKQYPKDSLTLDKPNVVILIVESYGREYFGAMNRDMGIKDYVSYTPFLDSLAQHSLLFPNAFANGRKSIHGMSSVLAGIPSFKVAFTSSAYAKQPIQSVVSSYNEMGYDTSFFHGAPNGSMGFLGFGNILGFDHYYGKTEYDLLYPDNTDFDGFWGIWDTPFLQYVKKEMDQKQEPFMSTIFTVSSHSPYIVPKEKEGKYPKGNVPMHQCVGYTDEALKEFFEAAKTAPWFENTIFVLTADHGNQVYYDEYKKTINRHTVPIMFYYPGNDEVMRGVDKRLAQQIDIYPTLLKVSGYDKPFRSWGRNLIGEEKVPPFVMTHSSILYQYFDENYICIFDGQNVMGFYDIKDKGLKNNLIEQRNEQMDVAEERCKAFVQDYMDRIMNRKLMVQ